MSAAQILRRLTATSTLAVGAMLFGAGTASLTTLPAGTNGYVLTMAAGVPSWSANLAAALPASYAIGDTLYASSTSALSRLAAVAVGQVLISAGVGVAPAWSASPSVTGSITAKPTTTAGIALDPNAATGNFTLSLSPANITAARRWSFPDRSDTVAGLGAQTFTGAQSISATLSVGGISPSAASVISLDSGATPSKAQFSCRANNAGSLAGLVYDKDNISILFDIDYSAGFIARATTGFNLNKAAGALILQSCTGQTIGSVVSAFTPILTLNTTGDMALNSATPSTSTITGALTVLGGAGIGGAIYAASIKTAGTSWVLTASGVAPISRLERNSVALWDSSVNASGGYEIIQTTPRLTISVTGTVTIPGAVGTGQLTATGIVSTLGTITAAAQAIDSSVTWNSGATAFTGWKLNVTDTASAAGSLLLDLQVGGVSKFSVRKDGLIKAATLSGFTGSTAGEIWSSSDQNCLQIYSGAITQNVSTVTYSCQNMVNNVGPQNTTAETSIIVTNQAIGTLIVPANFFKAQKRIRVKLRGVVGNTGTPTLTIKVKLGSVVMATTGAVTMVTTSGQKWSEIEADISCSSIGAGAGFRSVVSGQYATSATALSSFGAAEQNSTVDTTAAQTLSITAQFGTADVLNVMLYGYALVEVLS